MPFWSSKLSFGRGNQFVDSEVHEKIVKSTLKAMHFPEDETLVVDTEDIPERGSSSKNDRETQSRFKMWPICGQINPDLLVCKTFYFLFYGAYGSLFPLLAVYFKQLGLSPFEIGILIGIRPFIEFCAAPVWGGLADSYQKAKFILLLSLFSWLVFTESLAFVQPPKKCVEFNHNLNENSLSEPPPFPPPQERSDRLTRDLEIVDFQYQMKPTLQGQDKEKRDQASKVRFSMKQTRKTFLILLFLVIVGEFFCSPTHTLTDSATLSYLGKEKMQYYGRQRMFGSLGWGVSMLAMGILLDRTSVIRPGCEKEGGVIIRNYFICFGSFAVLITTAFLVATQIKFRYHSFDDTTELSELKQPTQTTDDKSKLTESDYGALQETPKVSGNEAESSPSDSRSPLQGPSPDSMRDVLRMYGTIRYGSVLFVAWFAGFGMGLLFAFLYWHLEELGSPALLFGLAAVVNHSSEVLTYFFSNSILSSIGHIPSLCIGLSCYALRCLAISVLYNPWWVLAIETLQGLTHALIWAAATSFLGQAVRQSLRSSAQGILQGTHHGLGRGCGAILGGVFVNLYGTEWAFRGFGIASFLVLVFLIVVQSPLLLGEEAEILTDIRKTSFKQLEEEAQTPTEEPKESLPSQETIQGRESDTGEGGDRQALVTEENY